MKIEETYKFWLKYIKDHPDKTEGQSAAVLEGGFFYISAPYRDIHVRTNSSSTGVVFYKNYYEYWHRLDGPAYIDKTGGVFYIEDVKKSLEEYERHPAVIEYRLNDIINEVLEENSDISETKITGEQNG